MAAAADDSLLKQGLSAEERWRALGGSEGALNQLEEGCRWTGDATAEIDSALIRQCNEGSEAGKITDLNFRFKFVQQISGLEQCAAHLRSLDLSTNNIRRIEGLAGMSKLRELKLYSCQISRIQNLDQCVCLAALHLEDNQISSVEGLDALRFLEYLNLDRNRVQRIGKGVCKLAKLKELHLSMNQLSSLEGVAGLSCLETLSVSHNRVSQVTAEQLKNLNKLDELLIGNNRLSKLDFLGVSAAGGTKTQPSLPNLATLDVSCNRLGSDALNGLPAMHQLVDLNLSSNQIQELPAGFTPTWPALEILDLSENQLHRPEDLASLKLTTSLRELTLQGNPVVCESDPEVVQKALCAFSGLERLDDRPVTPPQPEAEVHALGNGPDQEADETFKLTSTKPGGLRTSAMELTTGSNSRPSTASSRPGTASSRPGTAQSMKDMRQAGVKEPLMHMGPKLKEKRFATAEQVSQWEKQTLNGLAAVEKQIAKTNHNIETELQDMTRFLEKAEQVLRREKEIQAKRPPSGGYPSVHVSGQLPVLQSADSPQESESRRSSRVKFRLHEALEQSREDEAEVEGVLEEHSLPASAPASPAASAPRSPVHAAYDEEIIEEEAGSEAAHSEIAASEVDEEEVLVHEDPVVATAPTRRAPSRSVSPSTRRLSRGASTSAERPELKVDKRAERRSVGQTRTSGGPAVNARPPAMPVRTSSRGSRR